MRKPARPPGLTDAEYREHLAAKRARGHPLTQYEVAALLGMSRARVAQIEREAKRKIKAKMESEV